MQLTIKVLALLALGLLAACGSGGSKQKQTISQPPSNTAPTTAPGTLPTTTPLPIATTEPTTIPNPQEVGVSIIDTRLSAASFWPGNNNGSAVGSRKLVKVEHSHFDQAVQITASKPSGEFWNGQLFFPINTSINKGDVVLAHFYLRSIENSYESGNAFVSAFIEQHDNDYKYLSREVSAASDWVEYYLPAQISNTLASGELSLKFGFGAGDRPQVFEIAGVELLNFANTDIATLPATVPSYGGREADAAWRVAAAERIEQYRKSDFHIQVLDASGEPAANTIVNIEFQKHAYHFGSVTVGHILMDSQSDRVSDADSATYREKVLELFNQSGPENDLKWGPWEGEWGANYAQEQTLAGLQWLRDNGLYTRGHVMVWPSRRNLPKLMQAYLPEGDPASANPTAKQVVLDHIDDIASATADYLDEWDVVNEPYDNHYLMDAFGNEIMVDWFEQARTKLPSQGLYLNDYSILSASGRHFSHQDHFQQTLQYLVDNDAPITGMGMQSHFGESPTDIELVYSILERFHTAFPKLDIRSTEFDVSSTNEQLQADYTRDFLTIFFSHPATVGVQLWGFWQGAHWSDYAALYDINWREKPSALAWKDLIYKQWWNDFLVLTDNQGRIDKRGFYGDYKATITINEQSREFFFSLEPEGTQAFIFSFQDTTPE
ncbi:Endo-1,4-beta-xylanase, GH35 family [Alteromonadaceae bacterium Bs31]|nr:Endo-1,4-beta-xylanase, GH35 family [Alteromonadaceae bacterium Bs31]